MGDSRRVLVVARQAGAASALAPVVAALRAHGAFVSVLGFEHAHAAFAQCGISVQRITTDGEAMRALRSQMPDVLLTGTSSCAREDGALWELARRIGVPSVALLDHWYAYAKRFTPPGRRPFETTPDVIAVMDAAAQQRLVEAGCPPSVVRVTGQPAFDAILDRTWPRDGRLRHALDLPHDGFVVLFVSEPVGEEFGVDSRSATYLGYTETLVLELVLVALRMVADEHPVGIVVRPHPTEGVALLERVARRVAAVPWRFGLDVDPRQLAAGADAVVGMTSIFLLEAALMGRPTVSVRPDAREPCDLVALHPGLIAEGDTVEAVAAWLQTTLRDRTPRPLVTSGVGGAGDRVTALALELAAVARQ